MAARKPEAIRLTDTAFLGHPRGLAVIGFTEVWERFSYYGMQALLVLYMTQQLLLPGHVEHVLGFGPFRAALEAVYGPLSPLALGSIIFGLYSGLVYVTPILGGLLADRLTGRTRAVILGASLMAAGHFLMAFEASFLPALLCLLIGAGCFKGNLAAQIGDLYAADDPRRADAFQLYVFGIQIAVIVTPFVCGTLGEVYGWHWGFGAAGIGMAIGLAIYLGGLSWLPPERAIVRPAASRPPLSAEGWRTVLVLLLLVPVMGLALIGNQQTFNVYLVWGEAHYQLVFFGKTIPVTWLLSDGSACGAITIALSVFFWRWWGKRRAEPDEITKMAIGAVLLAAAPLVLVLAPALAPSDQRIGLGWDFVFEFVTGLGFANLYPIGMALFARAAPKGWGGLMIGIFFLHFFLANMLVGWLGGLLETMPGSSFWLLHAGLIGLAALILLAIRGGAGRVLAPSANIIAFTA
jgi:proton-dependent oligopeptide transporter, POT family